MNILEMRAAHPALFCPQTWYEGEEFVLRHVPEGIPLGPPWFVEQTRDVEGFAPLVPAAWLVAAFILTPDHPAWHDYLWTRDVDSEGQRVYVGGTANGCGFEIHRHLHLTERWGVPIWR